MNQWLKELDKFFQNIPEWYTMVWCGDERWSAANAAKFKDAQVIMTTKDTVVSDFMAYSPYWMTDRSQNRDGTSCVMYSPVDGEPRPGQIDRKSGNEFDKSLISRRSEGRKKGRVSPLYARKQGHAVFDLIFVDEGDLLRVESEHTGPGQVKKRSWQVCALPPFCRSPSVCSHRFAFVSQCLWCSHLTTSLLILTPFTRIFCAVAASRLYGTCTVTGRGS
jgi:hypothetical protein